MQTSTSDFINLLVFARAVAEQLKDSLGNGAAAKRMFNLDVHKNLRSTLVQSSPNWCPGRDLNPHSPCGKRISLLATRQAHSASSGSASEISRRTFEQL